MSTIRSRINQVVVKSNPKLFPPFLRNTVVHNRAAAVRKYSTALPGLSAAYRKEKRKKSNKPPKQHRPARTLRIATATNKKLKEGAKNDVTTATTRSVGKILSVLRSPRSRTQRLVPKSDISSDKELVVWPKWPIRLAKCSSASSPAVSRNISTPKTCRVDATQGQRCFVCIWCVEEAIGRFVAEDLVVRCAHSRASWSAMFEWLVDVRYQRAGAPLYAYCFRVRGTLATVFGGTAPHRTAPM